VTIVDWFEIRHTNGAGIGCRCMALEANQRAGNALDAPVRSPTALVLCGGGSRGAMEVGFYQALAEFGVRPDLILGCSIGALNGAFIAGGMAPSELVRLWTEFRLSRALGINWAWLRHWHRSPGFFSLGPLRALLRRTLPATRFEDLRIPLTVVTTDFDSGTAVYWHRNGDLIEPVIASMSLPGIFPPVEIGGRLHVDGGIANNVPLDKAEELGARLVYLIECACAERCARPLRGWRDLVVRSFSIAVGGRYAADLQHFHGRLDVFAVRPQLTREVDLLDFQHSTELMEAAYRQTRRFLEGKQRSAT
jgi:NTE family protein